MRARYLLALMIPFPLIIHAQSPGGTAAGDTLKKQPTTLKNVTVSGRRELYEQKPDRLVVNVADAIGSTGTTAMEVIERSPGVSVDKDGVISIKGKTGALVMIDGRQTYLSGTALTDMLSSMPSTGIDRIEIMTNPPARYDAAAGAGVILIRTKKSTAAGYNGSVTGSLIQGYLPKTSAGANLNYRHNKVNIYSSFSHSYRENFKTIKIDRAVRAGGAEEPQQYLRQDVRTDRWGNWYSGKAGIDYAVDKKTTIGLSFNGALNSYAQWSDNKTHISGADHSLLGQTTSRVGQENRFTNGGAGLSFRRQLDTAGREITADADYMRYNTGSTMYMTNTYADENGTPLSLWDTVAGDLPQHITIKSARVDYVHPLGKGFKLEGGVKGSTVRTDNEAAYDSVLQGSRVRDAGRSNHFIYEETIAAAYITATVPVTKKLRAELGLRYEHTHSRGRQMTTGTGFDRNYAQLFPKAYLLYTASKQHQYGLNYGRGIRRPDYENLNPFVRFIDRYTYDGGNPMLRPQIYNDLELSHTYKNRITTTLNYSTTTDIIQTVVEQRGQDAFVSPANIASLRQFGISVNMQNSFAPWWKNNLFVNVYHNQFQGEVAGAAVDLSAVAYSVDATQQFTLSQKTSAEVSGQYRSAGVKGVMTQRERWAATIGISRQVLKGAGSLKLSVRDIFYTMQPAFNARYGNVDVAVQEASDTRVLNLTFSYRFSRGKAAGPKKRSSGSAAEEQSRIGGE